MKAIIYCRVSTKEQAEHGYSLEAQEKSCRQFALDQSFGVDRVFIERGESAKTQDRTQLQNLIKYCVENKKKLSSLIIWKYDRLARNLSDQTELVKAFSSLGIRILSVTENNDDNAVGRMVRNIIGAFAQFENDVKSERTVSGMKQAILSGRWCWRAPFGYKGSRDSTNKPLIVPAEDSKYVVEAFSLFETGLYRQTGLVSKLRQSGLKKATPNLLNRILNNPLYAGLIKCKWFSEHIPAIHEAIISKETFFKVQHILTGKKPTLLPRSRNNPDFPLRRFLRCSKCDGKLTAGWSTGRNKIKYGHYHCFAKGCSFNIKKDLVETAFFEYLKSFTPREDILDLFNAIIIDQWNTKQSVHIKEEYRIEKELAELLETQKRIEELLIKGAFNEEAYKRNSEDLKAKILTKQVELSEARIDLNDIEACLNYCKFFVLNLAQLWASSEVDLKQRFQSLIFPEKVYYENGTFRTTATALIFKQLQVKTPEELQLVAPTGFEPVFSA